MNEVFLSFCGPITQETTGRFLHAFSRAMENQIEHVHLLLQSTGGFVGDGVCLYNYFRNLPIGLTIYNSGTISSIGVIAYVGATTRIASPNSTFMIHRSTVSPVSAGVGQLNSLMNQISMDDQRTQTILTERCQFPQETWNHFHSYDTSFSAENAVAWKVANSLGEFAPPKGTVVFNI